MFANDFNNKYFNLTYKEHIKIHLNIMTYRNKLIIKNFNYVKFNGIKSEETSYNRFTMTPKR